eukprot:scaffold165337_cov17-Tisochrysis_lutea.AAC.1
MAHGLLAKVVAHHHTRPCMTPVPTGAAAAHMGPARTAAQGSAAPSHAPFPLRLMAATAKGRVGPLEGGAHQGQGRAGGAQHVTQPQDAYALAGLQQLLLLKLFVLLMLLARDPAALMPPATPRAAAAPTPLLLLLSGAGPLGGTLHTTATSTVGSTHEGNVHPSVCAAMAWCTEGLAAS